MMEDELNFSEMNEKIDDHSDNKPEVSSSLTGASKSTISSITGQTAQSEAQSEAQSAASVCAQSSVERDQPKPLCTLLPASMEVFEVTQSITSISKTQESLKTTTIHTEPKGDDLCAAVLLACLFCHPVDCILATTRGCNTCLWSLCSSLCGLKPTTVQPVLDVVHQCNPCECLGVQCKTCECSVCDICLQATECLDLAMEISQMLYH